MNTTHIFLCATCDSLEADNNMNGPIPAEIGNLEAMERLVLSTNCLVGTLPPEMGLLSNLQLLDLQSNGLSGYVTDEFFDLSMLVSLNISYQYSNWENCTSSDGDVIEPFYQMGDPDNDENNGLEGNFLEKIGRLQYLKEVNLDQNSFVGSISTEIGNLLELGKLLVHVSIKAWILFHPIQLAIFSEFLSAGGNFFNGTIPEAMPTKLRELWMSTNDFSGPLPESIGNLTSLRECFKCILCIYCTWEVTVYSRVCVGIEIIYFWVEEDGNMNGTLPDSLYNLRDLRKISLSGHAFGGQIKPEIGNLKELTELKLSGNQFTGTLPSELGLCEKLGKANRARQ